MAPSGGAAAWTRGIRQQALVKRYEKRRGLSRTRLGLACNVLAGKRNRQSTRLDGCGADETRVSDATGDFWDEIERIEPELGKVCLCH